MAEIAAEWTQRIAVERQEIEQSRAELSCKEREVRELEERVRGLLGGGEDVVDLNAGGHLHSVSRGTLCLAEGSLLAALFSGRWEDSLQRDQQGRPFLDVDPHAFEKILGFLRLKRIESPEQAAPPPDIEAGKQEAFNMILRYYGLMDFLYPPQPFLSESFSPPGAQHTYPFQSEVRGYLVKFTARFRLLAVYVGLTGDGDGCEVIVGRNDQVIRTARVRAEASSSDPHVTHVAEGFDIVMEPPSCFIMIKGNGKAGVKYSDLGNGDRIAGRFSIYSKHTMQIQPNSYHVFMLINFCDT